jgi:hypothetical protein
MPGRASKSRAETASRAGLRKARAPGRPEKRVEIPEDRPCRAALRSGQEARHADPTRSPLRIHPRALPSLRVRDHPQRQPPDDPRRDRSSRRHRDGRRRAAYEPGRPRPRTRGQRPRRRHRERRLRDEEGPPREERVPQHVVQSPRSACRRSRWRSNRREPRDPRPRPGHHEFRGERGRRRCRPDGGRLHRRWRDGSAVPAGSALDRRQLERAAAAAPPGASR